MGHRAYFNPRAEVGSSTVQVDELFRPVRTDSRDAKRRSDKRHFVEAKEVALHLIHVKNFNGISLSTRKCNDLRGGDVNLALLAKVRKIRMLLAFVKSILK